MSRIYVVTFEQVAVAAAQDLVQVKGAAGKIVKIRRVWAAATDGGSSLPTSQMLSFRCRYLPATVTDGGGTGATPQKLDPGDAAASCTAIVNSTTGATTGGTAVKLEENGAHIYNGFDKTWGLEGRPTIGPSESFVFELLSTVAGTVHLSGGVELEESGG